MGLAHGLRFVERGEGRLGRTKLLQRSKHLDALGSPIGVADNERAGGLVGGEQPKLCAVGGVGDLKAIEVGRKPLGDHRPRGAGEDVEADTDGSANDHADENLPVEGKPKHRRFILPG